MRGHDRTAAHRRCGLPPSAAWRPRVGHCPGAAGRCTPDGRLSRRGRSLYAGRSPSRRGRSLYAGRSALPARPVVVRRTVAVPARPVVVRRTLVVPARPVVVRRTLGRPGAAGRCTPDARSPGAAGRCTPDARSPGAAGRCTPDARSPAAAGRCTPDARSPAAAGRCTPDARSPGAAGRCTPDGRSSRRGRSLYAGRRSPAAAGRCTPDAIAVAGRTSVSTRPIVGAAVTARLGAVRLTVIPPRAAAVRAVAVGARPGAVRGIHVVAGSVRPAPATLPPACFGPLTVTRCPGGWTVAVATRPITVGGTVGSGFVGAAFVGSSCSTRRLAGTAWRAVVTTWLAALSSGIGGTVVRAIHRAPLSESISRLPFSLGNAKNPGEVTCN